jgi:DNA mismatch endonuclease (patch repair protein)
VEKQSNCRIQRWQEAQSSPIKPPDRDWAFNTILMRHDVLNMADVFTKIKRSEVMSRIRSQGNKDTEVALANIFRRHKITGWRRNQKIFGKPDFVFRRERLAVFVDGCFWHGCPRHATKPKSNRSYWRRKLTRNKTRDKLVTRMLRKAGWHVFRIWECDLTGHPESCIRRILEKLIHIRQGR